jgi:hypothetical protein
VADRQYRAGKEAIMPGGGDRFLSTALLGLLLSARMLAVETDRAWHRVRNRSLSRMPAVAASGRSLATALGWSVQLTRELLTAGVPAGKQTRLRRRGFGRPSSGLDAMAIPSRYPTPYETIHPRVTPLTVSWPEVVGYRHEVLHTGVLRHLLHDPERGARVATALIDAEVVSVQDAAVERRVPGFKGVADLVAELELPNDEVVFLAIETKVDSNATQKQLAATVRSPHRGVLLALGLTALHLTAEDLGPELDAWSVVDPTRWASAIRSINADEDALLAPYFREIEREAREHGQARDLAQRQSMQGWRLKTSRRCDGLLEHYAWLAEIRRRLDYPEAWWTYTNWSAPGFEDTRGLWSKDQGQEVRSASNQATVSEGVQA